jgi:hypothetical protein
MPRPESREHAIATIASKKYLNTTNSIVGDFKKGLVEQNWIYKNVYELFY